MAINDQYLIYQAYGKEEILQELMYSIYSIINKYKQCPPFQIIVYTDNVNYLTDKLPNWIIYKKLDTASLNTWAGAHNFVHRIKIEIILQCLKQQKGNFLYIDTDTVIRGEIEELFNHLREGNHVMHVREGTIGKCFNKIDKILRKYPEFEIHSDVVMYNAGVIGVTNRDLYTVEEVLKLTDKLYHIYPKHTIEQLMFSYYLGLSKPIIEAQTIVYHYWNFKEFRFVLKQFFEFNSGLPYEVIASKIHQIDPEKLHRPKREYESLSFWPKAIRKLRKNRWQLPFYKLS